MVLILTCCVILCDLIAFYAGKWAASDMSGRKEDIETCVTALRKMKWAFSLGDDSTLR